MPDVSNPPGLTESGDVNHDETSNRTHDGDDLSPATLEADDGVFNGSITDPEGNTVTSLSDPVRVTEEASTFAESDVTVTNNGTTVSNGSIELGVSVSREADNTTSTLSRGLGIVINPNESLSSITVTLSSNTGSPQDVFIADTSETILDEKTAGYSAGDSVTLNASLSSGTDYYVGIYNDGNDYDGGTVDSGLSYPYTGSAIDIVAGVNYAHPDDGTEASELQNRAYGIKKVTFESSSSSGNALVEWDSGSPADIDSWDLATFQRTLDGETVTVDVEDGNSNVLFSDIGPNFDISSIDTSKDVKLRANLSRNDTSNNPTVDYLARRFTR